MCLIILKPPGVSIPADHIKNAWVGNNDGAGYVYPMNGELVVRRFLKLKQLLKNWERDLEASGADAPFLLHLRYGTSGTKDLDNVHPFLLNSGHVAIAHNGIISGYGDSKRCDTKEFAETVLAHRRREDVMSQEFIDWVATMVGSGNKIAFLDIAGNYKVANEKVGHWKDGAWYSNYNYYSTGSSYSKHYGYGGEATTVYGARWPNDIRDMGPRQGSFYGKGSVSIDDEVQKGKVSDDTHHFVTDEKGTYRYVAGAPKHRYGSPKRSSAEEERIARMKTYNVRLMGIAKNPYAYRPRSKSMKIGVTWCDVCEVLLNDPYRPEETARDQDYSTLCHLCGDEERGLAKWVIDYMDRMDIKRERSGGVLTIVSNQLEVTDKSTLDNDQDAEHEEMARVKKEFEEREAAAPVEESPSTPPPQKGVNDHDVEVDQTFALAPLADLPPFPGEAEDPTSNFGCS